MARVLCLALVAVACGVVSAQFNAPIPNPPPGPPIGLPTPCKGGFSVRKGYLRPDDRIFFSDVLHNGGRWDEDQAEFTALCDGLYFFSFHAVAEQNGEFTIALMKNGQYQVTAYAGPGGYQHGSNSALLQLKDGDRVYLQLQSGFFYEHPGQEAYTTFSGFWVEDNQF